ncbi:NAD(P)-dependent oxidoreductase [Opitutaceae bacterium]|nr:NAD(P)-dependent oxidoreductase [Opitutaceae bacterium]
MPSCPPKLLVTGASGFVGWNVCQLAAGRGWQVFGTTFSHPIDVEGLNSRTIDLRDFATLRALFADIQPDAVIHTAAAKDPNFCQENPAESHGINVDASVNLAGLCADQKIPFVFTSTDMVFDGTAAPYAESDPVSPIHIYGEQKVLAETRILARKPAATICRLPLMFGDAGPVAQSFLQPMVNQLKSGTTVNLFTDEYRTPISGPVAAQGLLLALEKASGILHLGGSERISRHDFGLLAVEAFKLSNVSINACRQADVKMAAPRAPDLSLDSTRANQLGFTPPSLIKQLNDLNQSQ